MAAYFAAQIGVFELASGIQESIHRAMRLHYSEREQYVGYGTKHSGCDESTFRFPTVEHSISLLPKQWCILPTKLDALCSFAMSGNLPELQLHYERIEENLNARERSVLMDKAVIGGHADAVGFLKKQRLVGNMDLFIHEAGHNEGLCNLLLCDSQNRGRVEAAVYGPLHYAAISGNLGVVRACLAAGFYEKIPDKKERPRYSPLELASMACFPEIVRVLAHHCREWRIAPKLLGSSLRMVTMGSMYTSTSTAAHELDDIRRREETLDAILEASPVAVQENDLYYEAVRYAAKAGQLSLLSKLLDKGPKLVSVEHQMQLGKCLCLAASLGHAETVSYLITCGVDPNAQNSRKVPALHLACMSGHESVVELLLKHHAQQKQTARANGKTAFQWAVANGHEGVVRLLLNARDLSAEGQSSTDEKTNLADFGSETLPLACASMNAGSVQLLLRRGALPQLEQTNRYGQTPLQRAASGSSADVVRTLIDAGADTTVSGKAGTPLEIAVAKRRVENVKTILESTPCEISNKTLMSAVEDSRTPVDLMDMLLAHSKDTDVALLLTASLGRRRYPWMTKWLLGRADIDLDSADQFFIIKELARRSERETLEQFQKRRISAMPRRALLVASASNDVDGLDMTKFLMDLYDEMPRFDLTVLKAAMQNQVWGAELVDYLLSCWGGGDGDELLALLDDAAENSRWAPKLFQHLIRRIKLDTIPIASTTVLKVAATWSLCDDAMRTLIEEPRTRFAPSAIPELLRHFKVDTVEMFLDKKLPHERFDKSDIRHFYEQAARNRSCDVTECDNECTRRLICALERRGFTANWTPDMLQAVTCNKEHSSSLMDHILKQQKLDPTSFGDGVPGFADLDAQKMADALGREMQVPAWALKAAVMDSSCDVNRITAALKREDGFIDEYILAAAAKNNDRADDLMKSLLSFCSSSSVTEMVVQTALAHPTHAVSLVDQLLQKLGKADMSVLITERTVTSALRNWGSATRLIPLLATFGQKLAVDEMEAIDAAKRLDRKTLEALLDAPFNLKPSQSLLQATAGNFDHGTDDVTLLLKRAPGLLNESRKVPKAVMMAIVSNWKCAAQIIEVLEKEAQASWIVTESILRAAASNPFTGVQVMTTLLKAKGAVDEITPAVLAAAAANIGCARALLKCLFRVTPSTMITEDVLRAAAANGSGGLQAIKELVKAKDAAALSMEVFKAAAMNSREGTMSVVVPLNRGMDIQVTPHMLVQETLNHTVQIKPPFVAGGSGAALFRQGAKPTAAKKQLEMRWRMQDDTTLTEARLRVEREWLWRDGCAVIEWLLEHEELRPAAQEMATHVSRNSNARMLKAFFSHGAMPTQRLLEEAVQNTLHGFEVTSLVLEWSEKHGVEGVLVTDETLLKAARNSDCGWAILPLLLRHDRFRSVPITVMDTALNRAWIDETCLRLLLSRLDYKINPSVLAKRAVKAIRHDRTGYELADYILFHCEKAGELSNGDQRTRHLITELMTAAAANPAIGTDICCMIMYRSSTIAWRKDAVAEAAVQNKKQSARLLRLLPPSRPNSFLLKCAATNTRSGAAITKWLLGHPDAARSVTPPVLAAAAGNMADGPQLVRMLLAVVPKPSALVTPEVMEAAASNWNHGVEVASTLLERSGPSVIDADVLGIAALNAGCGPGVLQLLLKASNPEPIPDSVRVAACGNIRYGHAMLEHGGILDQPPRVTRRMVQWAVENPGSGALLLERLLRGTDYAREVIQWLLTRPPDDMLDFTDSLVAVALRHESSRIQIREIRSDVLARLDKDTVDALISRSNELKILPPPSMHKNVLASVAVCRLINRSSKPPCLPVETVKWMFMTSEEHLVSNLAEHGRLEWLAAAADKPYALHLAEKYITTGEQQATPQLLDTALKSKNLEFVKLLLRHCPTLPVTVSVARLAVDQPTCFSLLLDRNPHLAAEDGLLAAAAQNPYALRQMLDRHPRASVPPAILEAASTNVECLKHILHDCPNLTISERVLLAAVSCPDALNILLHRSPRLRITERILRSAVRYPAALKLLFDNDSRPPPRITEAALADATNHASSLCFLLNRNLTAIASETVLLSAVRNGNRASLTILLERDRDAEITETVLIAAATKFDLMEILLERHTPLDLTEEVMNKAASFSLAVFKLLVARDEAPPQSDATLREACFSVCEWLMIDNPHTPDMSRLLGSSISEPKKLNLLLQKRPDMDTDWLRPDNDEIRDYIESLQALLKKNLTIRSNALQMLLSHPHYEVKPDNVFDLFQAFPGDSALAVITEYLTSRPELVTDALLEKLLQRNDAISTIGALEECFSGKHPIPVSEQVANAVVTSKPDHGRAIVSLFRSSKAFNLDDGARARFDEILSGTPSSTEANCDADEPARENLANGEVTAPVDDDGSPNDGDQANCDTDEPAQENLLDGEVTASVTDYGSQNDGDPLQIPDHDVSESGTEDMDSGSNDDQNGDQTPATTFEKNSASSSRKHPL